MRAAHDQTRLAILQLLEAGYRLRNSYKALRDAHPKPEEEQPITYFDLKGKAYWTKPGSIDPLSGDEALRAADVHTRWRNYFMIEYAFHSAYLPDEREQTPVQQAMKEWRKELVEQCGRLAAQSRESDALLMLADREYELMPAGEIYPKRPPRLEELRSERLSEVLEQHVRQLVDDAEPRDALPIQIKFDLPTILKRAMGGRKYQVVADDMGCDIDTLKSWASGRRYPDDDNFKKVSAWVLKELMPG